MTYIVITLQITTIKYSYETNTDDPSDKRINNEQHYNYDEDQNKKKKKNFGY